MAEIALRNVEQGLEELEQLERIGLFEKTEIKAIIKKRKQFEFRMRRFAKSRADFLEFINYELSLFKLIQKRRERTRISFKKNEIDHAITRRIDLLFRKAEYKFIGDVSLWFSHIEFCKLVKWKSHASQLFTRLLQLHPTKASAWVAAAKFDLEELGEADAARKTLQRGLRFLKDSRTLWQEYLRMELVYWEKINRRQEVLELDSESARDALLEGAIVVLVFTHAVEAIPQADFAVDLLKIVRRIEGAEKLHDEVLQIAKERFSDSAAMWSLKASSAKTVREAFDVFESALRTTTTTTYSSPQTLLSQELWPEYVSFALRLADSRKQPKYVQVAMALMERAEAALDKGLPRDLALERVRLTRDLTLARRATERFRDDLDAWTLRLLLECQAVSRAKAGQQAAKQQATNTITGRITRRTAANKTDSAPLTTSSTAAQLDEENFDAEEAESDIRSVFDGAERACLSQKDLTSLWKVALNFYKDTYPEKLNALLERGILKPGATGVFVKEFMLDETLAAAQAASADAGRPLVRKLFGRLMTHKPLSMAIYDKFLQAFADDPAMVRRVFEEAVREFGTNNEDLWLSYLRWEQHNGSADNSGVLYQRALNSLQGAHVKEFVTLYTLEMQQ